MTKKMTNKEIVGEAMYSVKRSLTANIPPPPTNSDGTFKSVDQLVSERRLKEWQQQKTQERAYSAAVSRHEEEIRNDPEQRAWEAQQRHHQIVHSFNPKVLVILSLFMLFLFVFAHAYQWLHNAGVVGCLPGAMYCS